MCSPRFAIPIEGVFDYFQGLADGYDAPLWIGEYGWFSDPAAQRPKLVRYAAKEDALLTVGSAWWQWRQACGDPHSVGSPGGTPAAIQIHFRRNGCPGDHDLGVVPEWSCTWRPYPRAVPGRLRTRIGICDGPLALVASTRTAGLPVGLGQPLLAIWPLPVQVLPSASLSNPSRAAGRSPGRKKLVKWSHRSVHTSPSQ